MRSTIVIAVPLVAAVLFSPTDGAAQASPAVFVAVAKVPTSGSLMARAHQNPRIPPRPRTVVSKIEVTVDAPSDAGVDEVRIAEARKEDSGESRTVIEDGAFLFPVWHSGFWVMPPGGLTRRLLQQPVLINP